MWYLLVFYVILGNIKIRFFDINHEGYWLSEYCHKVKIPSIYGLFLSLTIWLTWPLGLICKDWSICKWL
jgi:hypothetical protein